jgi:hypothetical protein
VIRVGKVGEVISPVREVQGEILVSVTPVVADPLVALDDEGLDAESLKSSRDVKTTERCLAYPVETAQMATYQ